MNGLRINHDIGKEKKPVMIGELNKVPIYDVDDTPEPEGMFVSKKTFEILEGIIDGFLKLGRGEPVVIKEAVNKFLLGKDMKVSYIETTSLGFYHYKIEYNKKEIEFYLEPDLVPIYNYCVNDMIRRHKATPHPSYVSTEKLEMSSPLHSIDEAIRTIADLKKNERLPE